MSCGKSLNHINEILAEKGAAGIAQKALELAAPFTSRWVSNPSAPYQQPFAIAATAISQIACTLNRDPEEIDQLLPVGDIAAEAIARIFINPPESQKDYFSNICLQDILSEAEGNVEVDVDGKKVLTPVLDEKKGMFGCYGNIQPLPTLAHRNQAMTSVLNNLLNRNGEFANDFDLIDDDERKSLNKRFADRLQQKENKDNSATIEMPDLLVNMLAPELVDGKLADNIDVSEQVDRYMRYTNALKEAPVLVFDDSMTPDQHGTDKDPVYKAFSIMREKIANETDSTSLEEKMANRTFRMGGANNTWEVDSSGLSKGKSTVQTYMLFNSDKVGDTYEDFMKLLDVEPPITIYAMDEKEKKTKEGIYDSQISISRNKAVEQMNSAREKPLDGEAISEINIKHNTAPRLMAKANYNNFAFPLTVAASKALLLGNTKSREAIAKKLAPGISKMLADSLYQGQKEVNTILPTFNGTMGIFMVNPAFCTRVTRQSENSPQLSIAPVYLDNSRGNKLGLGNSRVAEFNDIMSTNIRADLEKELVSRGMDKEKAQRHATLLSRNGFMVSSLSSLFYQADQMLLDKGLNDKLGIFIENAKPKESNLHHV